MTTTRRRLIRPDAPETKRDTATRAVRRKQTPPEQTHAEEFYYLKQMGAKTPMVLVLTNDEELTGWIEWYDKGSLKLNRSSGPNLLIRKDSIRYMYKEEERRRQRRTARRAPSKKEAPVASIEEVAVEKIAKAKKAAPKKAAPKKAALKKGPAARAEKADG